MTVMVLRVIKFCYLFFSIFVLIIVLFLLPSSLSLFYPLCLIFVLFSPCSPFLIITFILLLLPPVYSPFNVLSSPVFASPLLSSILFQSLHLFSFLLFSQLSSPLLVPLVYFFLLRAACVAERGTDEEKPLLLSLSSTSFKDVPNRLIELVRQVASLLATRLCMARLCMPPCLYDYVFLLRLLILLRIV